jgi:hypothetical protein
MANDFMGALRAANYEYKTSYVAGGNTASTDALEAARDAVVALVTPVDAAAAKAAMEAKAAAIDALAQDVAIAQAEYSVAADEIPEVPESSPGAGDGTPAVPAVVGGELIAGYSFEVSKLYELKNELVSAQAKFVAYTYDDQEPPVLVVREGEYADAAAKTAAVDAAQAAVDAQGIVVDGAKAALDDAVGLLEVEKAAAPTLAELEADYRAATSNDVAVDAIGEIGEAEA